MTFDERFALRRGGGESGGGSTPAPSSYALTRQSNGNLTYKFAEGSYPTGSLTAVTVNGTGRSGQITQENITYNATNGFFKITSAGVTACSITEGNTTVVATIGGSQYTFTSYNRINSFNTILLLYKLHCF